MRNEEQVANDILFYEKKSTAREHMADFSKKNRRVLLVVLCAAFVSIAVGWRFIIKAYDSENIMGILLILGIIFIVSIIAGIIAANIFIGSPAKYFKSLSLNSRWQEAEEQMKKMEEKFLERTVYEDDVIRAEETMISLAEKINAFFGEK